ncbi:cellulose synthase-like protein E1 [Impatiens glandulifera]|uniref:cellulose synthase-like protein E1 n=1 Tax=Impatiens glandulifera TaxID=253017 RepID=UPI001FB07B0C|nr:cellulose synthase-like protein E1 [Impatiens glandulifera]
MGSGSGSVPLFETRRAKGNLIYRSFALSIFVGIALILIYRVAHLPNQGQDGRFPSIGLLVCELWFAFYWIITQAARWKIIFRHPLKDNLSLRFEKDLPRIDVFVCTADPAIEPPLMVINTVLSVMAYDYPPEKLSVYLSDDAGSDITFYAMLEASRFSTHWLPYCRKFNVEPRSPMAYFASQSVVSVSSQPEEFVSIKKLYEDMAGKITRVTELGKIPEDVKLQHHKGFSKWDSYSSRRDHDTILEVIIDGRDPKAADTDSLVLPTLVYLAREKRPQYHHNFKAGAMNALIRVSSEISKGQIILNVDCDMYSNNSQAMRDALCFFMDEKHGPEIAYVQFPQEYANDTKNGLYGSLRTIDMDFRSLDGLGGPLYIGSGCFHRRDTLCGKIPNKELGYSKWKTEPESRTEESLKELEERVVNLANCAFEDNNTQWGNEVGLKYGCPVEDVITGLSIQCRGWKSVYMSPKRPAFMGIGATSLEQILVQHNRWSEGDFQIFLSKHNPFLKGFGKISLGLQMGYCTYCLWAVNSFPVLYYSLVPSMFLLKGIAVFPQVSSAWFLPFGYVIIAKHVVSLIEFLYCEGTALGWLNEQRIWLYKRTSAYLLAFVDTIMRQIGFSELKFVISSKVSDDNEMAERYENEIMELGAESSMFTILASLAMINLLCLVFWVVKKLLGSKNVGSFDGLALQIVLCGALVGINWPMYGALFYRQDKGKMPSSITTKSLFFSVFVCTLFAFLY